MPDRKSIRSTAFITALVLTFVARSAPVEAKVAFTGYGDIRLSAGDSDIGGSPAVLSLFNVRDTTTRPRTARLESIGLFATTSLSPELDFLMDVTYREIAATPNQVRVQYAYLDYRGPADTRLAVGRFPLPFGYLNQNRFYAFDRMSITPPVYHNGILGLPISDAGVTAQKRQKLGPVVLVGDVYAVNGYGPVSGSTTSFRPAGLGGLVVANNLGSRDANNRSAYGGRISLLNEAGTADVGASYYAGHWDPAGNHLFQMMNGHLHATFAGFDVLGEYLVLQAEGDAGFAAAVGHPDWKTAGYFLNLWRDIGKLAEMPVVAWARWEDYATIGDGGGAGREKLRGAAGGLALKATDQLTLKLEASQLYFLLPMASVASNVDLVSKSYLFGISFTF